jgi:hypothetical protein
MMRRMTLQEVREALAAAKARKKAPKAPVSPTVRELESLAQLLEREVEKGTPAEKPRKKRVAGPGASADGGDRGGSRRRARPRSPRRR